jgi:molecular chaperone Hsp33
MATPDTLQRFLFEHAAVRGELVHLDSTFRAVRDTHDYPPAVRALLGEALAAAALLSASIKGHDSLIVQVQGDGPLHLVVAQCSSRRSLRGVARWSRPVAPGTLGELCGEGRIVITIDPGQGRDRHQGLVALEGASLGQAIEGYFAQSEQLPTRLRLACDGACAAGLLVQSVPAQREDSEDWARIGQLAATVTAPELLTLPVRDLLRRLFREDDLRLFEPEVTTFRCTCGRAAIEAVLRSLGRAEVEDALASEGELAVTCEFCNRRYRFDRVDVETIFSAGGATPPSAGRH